MEFRLDFFIFLTIGVYIIFDYLGGASHMAVFILHAAFLGFKRENWIDMGRWGNLDYVSSSYSHFPLSVYCFPWAGFWCRHMYYLSCLFSLIVSVLRLYWFFWE